MSGKGVCEMGYQGGVCFCVRDGVSGRGVCVRGMGCLGWVCVCVYKREIGCQGEVCVCVCERWGVREGFVCICIFMESTTC